MEFRVLGPVEALAEGHRVDLGPRKQRFVFGVLLLSANRFVPIARLIDLTWAGSAPPAARNAMHAYISRLRTALDGAGASRHAVSVDTDGPGYVLRTDPMLIDAHRFRALLAQARQSGDDHRASALLREALDLWRGPALAGAAVGAVREQLCRGLEEAWLAAIEDRIDADLRLGRHRFVLEELSELVARHPLRERLMGQLMLSLYRSGQAARALAAYRRLRARLAEEAGMDPGPRLRELELAILRDDTSLGPPAPAPAARPIPAQLPADVTGFTGRSAELARLDHVLAERDHGARPTAFVAISGPGGIGKTGLALHWAHTVGHRFPDGRIYLDLHGFGGAGPLDPGVALERVLRALGVEGNQVPADPDERAAQYRSLLATRRVLLVLDNVASSGQARPLLPGAGGSAVVLTSRRRLDGLAVHDGVTQLPLAPLAQSEATGLIARLVGPERAGREPEEVAKLARICDRLPLAVRIAAARLAIAPDQPIAELVAELDDEQRRLPGLALDGDDAAVQAAFAVSYRRLDAGAARLFRLLGLHPGPQPSLPACAALADLPVWRTAELLSHLASVTLVQRCDEDRFTLHDLVRLYARERADAEESPERRSEARRRVLGWYLATADAADATLGHKRSRLTREPVCPAAPIPQFEEGAQALALMDLEGQNLVDAVRLAAREFPDLACRLADAMYGWVDRRHHRTEWVETYGLAAGAAARIGDREAEALLRNAQAVGQSHMERYDEAIASYERSLQLRRELGDPKPLAATMINLGAVFGEMGQDERACAMLDHAAETLEPAPDAQHLVAGCLINLGWVHHRAGRGPEAVEAYTRSLWLSKELGDVQATCYAQINLGEALQAMDRPTEALEHFAEALPLATQLGNRLLEAWALEGLGTMCHRLGRPTEARQHLTGALERYAPMGDPKAAHLRELLEQVNQTLTPTRSDSSSST